MNSNKYAVLIYPAAERDFREVKEYFTEVLKIKPNPLFQKVNDSIAVLEENPYLYPLVKDSFLGAMGYRMVPVDNYLLFYVVKEKTVQLHRFLYGKRDYLHIL